MWAAALPGLDTLGLRGFAMLTSLFRNVSERDRHGTAMV